MWQQGAKGRPEEEAPLCQATYGDTVALGVISALVQNWSYYIDLAPGAGAAWRAGSTGRAGHARRGVQAWGVRAPPPDCGVRARSPRADAALVVTLLAIYTDLTAWNAAGAYFGMN